MAERRWNVTPQGSVSDASAALGVSGRGESVSSPRTVPQRLDEGNDPLIGLAAHFEMKLVNGAVSFAERISPGVSGRVMGRDLISLIQGTLRAIGKVSLEGHPCMAGGPISELRVAAPSSVAPVPATYALAVVGQPAAKLAKQGAKSTKSKLPAKGSAPSKAIAKGAKPAPVAPKGASGAAVPPVARPNTGARPKERREPAPVPAKNRVQKATSERIAPPSPGKVAADEARENRRRALSSSLTDVAKASSSGAVSPEVPAGMRKRKSARNHLKRSLESKDWKRILAKLNRDPQKILEQFDAIPDQEFERLSERGNLPPLERYGFLSYDDVRDADWSSDLASDHAKLMQLFGSRRANDERVTIVHPDVTWTDDEAPSRFGLRNRNILRHQWIAQYRQYLRLTTDFVPGDVSEAADPFVKFKEIISPDATDGRPGGRMFKADYVWASANEIRKSTEFISVTGKGRIHHGKRMQDVPWGYTPWKVQAPSVEGSPPGAKRPRDSTPPVKGLGAAKRLAFDLE